MKAPVIGIIAPCHNEAAVLPEVFIRLHNALASMMAAGSVDQSSFIAFVDDGSSDGSWQLIEEAATAFAPIKGLKLASNVGHQKALFAGLITFMDDADALVSIDADLQDDVRAIEEMVAGFRSGHDVVYAVRRNRSSDTVFKRTTADWFYRMMKGMNANTVYNHADYRLCSKRVLQSLAQFGEVNLFLRGIIPSIGFKSTVVFYDRQPRFAGTSKYSLYKMLAFAWNGITSFSNFPLKLVTIIGFAVFIACLCMSGYALLSLYHNHVVPGWVSTVLPMYFLGGIQLFCVGILGEYIGKIYMEVKKRPRYFIDKRVD